MVRHIVMFRWIDGVTDEQRAAVRRALAALPGSIPEIADYRFGEDLDLSAGNYDFAIVADFRDGEAFLRYAQDPTHLATVAEHIRPIVRERVAVQHRW